MLYMNETWLAFIDIAGFTKMMDNPDEAYHALDCFYNTGYDELTHQKKGIAPITGLFVTDCGILFSRYNARHPHDKIKPLERLLGVVERISRRMIAEDQRYMLSTSIAYGYFQYETRKEAVAVKKMLLQGGAYLTAYLDNEKKEPKLRPGLCRLIIDQMSGINGNDPRLLRHLEKLRLRRIDNHYYFYWMVNQPGQVDEFEQEFSAIPGDHYEDMKRSLWQHAANAAEVQ